jgi:hypothetical protein
MWGATEGFLSRYGLSTAANQGSNIVTLSGTDFNFHSIFCRSVERQYHPIRTAWIRLATGVAGSHGEAAQHVAAE